MAYGPSVHCGGSHVLLSAPLLSKIVSFSGSCLRGPHRTTLAWYWDEGELLGRCVYEHLRLNCSDPPDVPVSKNEIALGLIMAISNPSDFDALDEYVKDRLTGAWERLPIASLHPVEAPYMKWLGRRFGSAHVPSRAGNFTEQEELIV